MHRYVSNASHTTYEFDGTNSRKSVLYVFAENKKEMNEHDAKDAAIKDLTPLRPLRQKCVISRSGTYATNLPADFLIAIIQLDFDLHSNPFNLTTEYLFPGADEDRFLQALKLHPQAKNRISDFYPNRGSAE